MSETEFIDESAERSKATVARNALAEAVIQLVDSERRVRNAAMNYQDGSALRVRLVVLADQMDRLSTEALEARRLIR